MKKNIVNTREKRKSWLTSKQKPVLKSSRLIDVSRCEVSNSFLFRCNFLSVHVRWIQQQQGRLMKLSAFTWNAPKVYYHFWKTFFFCWLKPTLEYIFHSGRNRKFGYLIAKELLDSVILLSVYFKWFKSHKWKKINNSKSTYDARCIFHWKIRMTWELFLIMIIWIPG